MSVNRVVPRTSHWWERWWFLIGLFLVLAAGLVWPSKLDIKTRWPVVPDVLVFAVIFITALPHEFRLVIRTMTAPGPTLLAVLLNSLALPLIAWPLSRLLPMPLGLGLIVASAVPSTIASAAVWTRRAGGNELIPLLVTSVTHMTCFVVTPLWIWLLIGRRIEIAPAALAKQLMILVFLPMLLAQFARIWDSIACWAARQKEFLAITAQVGILSMVAMGAATCGKQLQSGPISGTHPADLLRLFLVVIVLHSGALVLGQWLARRLGYPRGDWIAVGFAGSQKTLMVGLHTSMVLGNGPVMFPMVAYHVLQLIIDSWIAERLRQEKS